MPEAVIVDAVRTPIGRAGKGSLVALRPDDMGAFIVDKLLERNPELDPALVDELVCGCGLPQGVHANNIARVVGLLSKLPATTTASTISRYCASGLDAIRIAANNIRAGQGNVYIAGGVEWVSQYGAQQETVHPEDHHPALTGGNGNPDYYMAMGLTAEKVAERYGVSRESMDEYALRSHQLAVAAQESGFFAREIAAVTTPDGVCVEKDDGPRADTTLERLASLKPAFVPDGTVTAGNACPLNDGAAAALIMSDREAARLGLTPRARVITAASAGNEPEYMGVAPIGAIKKVLAAAGMAATDVDIVELNEAFAAQVLPIVDECGIDMSTVNPHGGAIALGHPFGMTGVRIMTTLLNDLETLDKSIGLESMCVAGGQGAAMLVERL